MNFGTSLGADDDGSASPASSGLSNVHICTPTLEAPPEQRDESGEISAVATVWAGGSLVEVERIKSRSERETAAKGAVRKLAERQRGGTRGKVNGFSSGSRRRLLKLFGRLRNDALPLFVTLTLPDGAPCDGKSVKDKYLRRFKARLARKFPGASFIWRMEIKRRKSGADIGRAYPHLHLVLWGCTYSAELRAWLSLTWYECVDSGDEKHLKAGTNVQRCRNGRQLKAYASKLYAAKSSDNDGEIEEQGRVWGLFSEESLPWALAVMRPMSAGETVRLLRTLRGYVRAATRRRKGKRRKVRGWQFCFVGDSERWADLLEVGALCGAA